MNETTKGVASWWEVSVCPPTYTVRVQAAGPREALEAVAARAHHKQQELKRQHLVVAHHAVRADPPPVGAVISAAVMGQCEACGKLHLLVSRASGVERLQEEFEDDPPYAIGGEDADIRLCDPGCVPPQEEPRWLGMWAWRDHMAVATSAEEAQALIAADLRAGEEQPELVDMHELGANEELVGALRLVDGDWAYWEPPPTVREYLREWVGPPATLRQGEPDR